MRSEYLSPPFPIGVTERIILELMLCKDWLIFSELL